MNEPTTSATGLLTTFLALVAAHRPALQQERCFQRFRVLSIGLLCALNRHTLTQVLVSLGLGALDWSGAYRLFSAERIDYAVLVRHFLRETLPHVAAEQPYLVALDGVQFPHPSWRLAGTSWLHDPQSPPFKRGIHRAQRYSHLAWLTPPTATGESRALPLRLIPAFPEKALRPEVVNGDDDWQPRTEWQAGRDQLEWLRQELDDAGRADQPVLAIGDGLYSTAKLWTDLPERVSLLARCPKNRALYALPTPATGRGRPRKYGERAPTPQAWLADRTGWTECRLPVRGRLVPCIYRVEGPYLVKGAPEQPLFLLVIKGIDRIRNGRRIQRAPTFQLVSAVQRDGQWVLPFPAEDLLGWAWQRWEIEVTHRELKTDFGVGESQAWSPSGTVLSVQWRVWVWSVAVLAGYRVWGLTPGPLRALGRWWRSPRRWSFGTLWQGYRQDLFGLPDFQPRWSATPTTWTEILEQPPPWDAALLGSRQT
jgi:hypothetical protein